jgi:anti-sigma regulatory factor (Ser/Thr protein kinase)
VTSLNPAYRATFTSDPKNVSLARAAVAGFARLCGFDETAVADIRLAAGEALSNASEHGGGYSVRCAFENGVLQIEVEDSGAGFDAPPRTAAIFPDHRNRGFGIFLMRQLMDDVSFAGNRVQLTLRRGDGARVSTRRAGLAKYRAPPAQSTR